MLPSSAFAPVITPIFTPATKSVSLTMQLPQNAATSSQHRLYVAGHFGNHFVSSDPYGGNALGAGASADIFITDRWAIDVEAWQSGRAPSQIADVRTSQRGDFMDTLVGVSALRRFGGAGVSPYLTVGVIGTRTQTRTPSGGFTINQQGPQVGFGLMIPAGQRLFVVPEIRVMAEPLFVIARPTIGITYRLR